MEAGRELDVLIAAIQQRYEWATDHHADASAKRDSLADIPTLLGKIDLLRADSWRLMGLLNHSVWIHIVKYGAHPDAEDGEPCSDCVEIEARMDTYRVRRRGADGGG